MKSERPTIVCLCGSTRFIDAFRAANLRETIAGKIVLSIGCDTKSDTDLLALGELTEEAKAALDELHKRKIDLADEVLILNVGGYIGKSTLSEIIYADRLKKPLRWLEAMQCPCCKGRGGFDSAEDSHECALCHGAAPPHLRIVCTYHTCNINAIGVEPGDSTWNERYFSLREEADILLFTQSESGSVVS
jgi:hypothetical protein